MKKLEFQIERIPAVLYGEKADKLYLFVHGKCGCKEEAEAFSETVCPLGWQVLSIDLPAHGSRRGEAGTFDPWHVVSELRVVLDYANAHWSRAALRANSIGAWFSMLAFQETPPEQALFVSPVLDMTRLIDRMMQWAGITEAELETRGTVAASFGETLSWPYYQYAKANPIKQWVCPTSILYAGQDALTPRQEVDEFSARFHCDLTVMENGEHWFHTPEQLEVMRRWEQSHTAPELSPEECLFFAGTPEEQALYTLFRSHLLTEVGEAHIKVSKTQITFSGKHVFAFVSHPRRKQDHGILVSFGLSHRQESNRIQYASEPYPNRWTHHLLVQTQDEIDEELISWLQEAYWFANTK